jgi:tRNA(fMet)-specific endonuclease VapC
MTRYLLDTNLVSQLVRRHPLVLQRVTQVPMASLCISAITEGELRFGLARRPEATSLHRLIGEFLCRVEVLPWDGSVAVRYGVLRADLERTGRVLGAFDLLIAAHAQAAGAVLVSNDQAFRHVDGLVLEDWTVDACQAG